MAVSNAMKAMWGRMGFAQDVAAAIETIFGYGSLAEVSELFSEEDAAVTLCKTIRRWEDGNGNKPYQVNMRAELNTVKLLFFLAHMERTSRIVSPSDVTVPRLKSMDLQRKIEMEHNSSTATVPVIDDGDWSKTLEALQEYLNLHRGITGIPLGYVVRSEIKVKAAADDPSRGSQGSEYETDDHEMIARAPILTAAANNSGAETKELEALGPFSDSFVADNLKVYNLLLPVFQKHSSLTYFKEVGRKPSKNGRRSFRAVWDHFLGDQMVDHLAGKWEKELQGLKYMGEGRNGNFDQYCTQSKDLHQKLDSLKQYGYQGFDERTKVRYFVQGLRHTSMENCKLHIQGRPDCRQDFDASVQVCRDFIQSDMSTGEKSLNIAAVGSGSGGMSVEDQQLLRWYELDEWKTFDKSKQEKIISLRRARKGGGKSKGTKAHKKAQHKVAQLEKSNARLVKKNDTLRKQVQIAALAKKGDDTDSSDSDGDEDDGFPSTRGQVKRKKKKKKRKSA